MKVAIFNLGLKISQWLANGNTMPGEVNSQATGSAFFDWLLNAAFFVWNGIMSLIYLIIKFALNIVDLLQFFVQRLVGIDYWLDSTASVSDLKQTDVLFRFMLSEPVTRVFRLLIIVSIVLLIVFSIVAIVKTEYASATTEKPGNKKAIFTNAMKAIFMVAIVPIILVCGVLASNAILASILNAVRPTDNNLTLGGQIFVASAYTANKYRLYSEEQERRPTTFTYTFAYNIAKGSIEIEAGSEKSGYFYGVVGSDIVYFAPKLNGDVDDGGSDLLDSLGKNKLHVLRVVLNSSGFTGIVNGNNGDVKYKLLTEFESLTEESAGGAGGSTTEKDVYRVDFETGQESLLKLKQKEDDKCVSVACSTTQYHTIDSVFESINPNEYNASTPFYGFVYTLKDDTSLIPKCYLARFNGGNGINKLATFHYLTNVYGANVITSNLGVFQITNSVFDENFFSNIGNSWSGIIAFLATLGETEYQKAWATTSINLDSCGNSHPLIIMARNTWPLAKMFKGYVEKFDKTIITDPIAWRAQSGRTFTGIRYLNNPETWGKFDGGSYGYVPARVEYEIMGDFIDFAVRYGVDIHIVNSQNPLIDWSGINQDSYARNDINGLYELHNEYTNIGHVVYQPTNTDREDRGAIFLMCAYNTKTAKFDPIVPNKTFTSSKGDFTFKSDYYPSKAEKGLVIARGIFDDKFDLQPTIITEEYYIQDGTKLAAFGVPSSMGIRSGEEKINSIRRTGTVGVSINEDCEIPLTNKLTDTETGVTTYQYTPSEWFKPGSDFYYASNFTKFKQVVFPETLSGGFSYADSRNASVTCNTTSGVITALIKDATETYTLTFTPVAGSSLTSFETEGRNYFMVQMKDSANQPCYNQQIESLFNLNVLDSAEAYDITTNDILDSPASMSEVFADPAYAGERGNVALVLYPKYTYVLDDELIVSEIRGNAGSVPQSSQFIENLHYRTWQYADKTGAVIDVYIRDGGICLVPYHSYHLTSDSSGYDVSGLDLVDVAGYAGSGNSVAYVKYDNENYRMLNKKFDYYGVNYLYTSTTPSNFTLQSYIFETFDSFACYITPTSEITNLTGNYESVYNIRSLSEDSIGEAVPLSSFKVQMPYETIKDGAEEFIYGIKVSTKPFSKAKIFTIYSAGEIVATITARVENNFTENPVTIERLADLMIKRIYGGESSYYNDNYILGITSKGEEYNPVPKYSKADILQGDKVKPTALVFIHDKLNTEFLTLDVNFNNGITAIRFYPRLFDKTNVGVKKDFRIDDGSFALDYNFDTKTGIGLSYIYQPYKLNIIVLVFSTIVIFKILMQSAWGLVKRIYDITILFMVMPGFAATMPIDGGERFNKWKDKLIKSVFSAYGVLIGINIFFILVPVIDGAVGNLFTFEDLPSTLTGASIFASNLPSTLSAVSPKFGGLGKLAVNALFARPQYLNELVKIMFLLVALTLMQSLPGLISDITGFGDAYKDGGNVKGDVSKMVSDVSNVTSGNALINAAKEWIGQRDENGKFHAGRLADFIPGSGIARHIGEQMGRWKDKLAEREDEGEKRGRQRSAPAASPSGTDATPANNTDHSANADVAGVAGRLGEFEENDAQQITGTREPTDINGLVDTEEDENRMAAFLDSCETLRETDPNAYNQAFQEYDGVASGLVDKEMQNAMFNEGGEFTVRDRDLGRITDGLEKGFTASVFRTGEKDQFTGEDIWAVSVARTEGYDAEQHKALSGELAGIDSDIARNAAEAKQYELEYDEHKAEAERLRGEMSGIIGNRDADSVIRAMDESQEARNRLKELTGVHDQYMDQTSNLERQMAKIKDERDYISQLSSKFMSQEEKTAKLQELDRQHEALKGEWKEAESKQGKTFEEMTALKSKISECESELKGIAPEQYDKLRDLSAKRRDELDGAARSEERCLSRGVKVEELTEKRAGTKDKLDRLLMGETEAGHLKNIASADREVAITTGSREAAKATMEATAKELHELDRQVGAFVGQENMEAFKALRDKEVSLSRQRVSTQQEKDKISARMESTMEASAAKSKELKELEAVASSPQFKVQHDSNERQKINRRIRELRQGIADDERRFNADYERSEQLEQKRTDLDRKIADNSDAIKTITKGKDSSEFRDLVERRDLAKTKLDTSTEEYKQAGMRAAQARDTKDKAVRGYETYKTTRSATLRTVSETSAKKYEAASVKADDLSALGKVIGSSEPQAQKDKAVNEYIAKHHSGASEAEKTALRSTLSTESGVTRAAKKNHQTMVTYATISDGAQNKANKYSGHHEKSHIEAINEARKTAAQQTSNGGNGTGTSGGGSTSNGTGTSSGMGGGGSTSTGTGTGGGTSGASTQQPRQNIIKRTANRVAGGVRRAGAEIKRIVTPSSQGDKLSSLYEKSLKAESAGKTRKVNKINRKMVKVAAESKTIREEADAEFIKKVSKASGKAIKSIDEARDEATKIKAKSLPDSDIAMEIERAEKKRTKEYNRSKLQSGKTRGADYEGAVERTREVAKKGVSKQLKSYNKKIERADRAVDNATKTFGQKIAGVVKRKPRTSIGGNAKRVKSANNEYELRRQNLINEGYGDIENMTSKQVKKAVEAHAINNGVSEKIAKRAGRHVVANKKLAKVGNEAKTKLKTNTSSRAINALNLDDSDVDGRL